MASVSQREMLHGPARAWSVFWLLCGNAQGHRKCLVSSRTQTAALAPLGRECALSLRTSTLLGLTGDPDQGPYPSASSQTERPFPTSVGLSSGLERTDSIDVTFCITYIGETHRAMGFVV